MGNGFAGTSDEIYGVTILKLLKKSVSFLNETDFFISS